MNIILKTITFSVCMVMLTVTGFSSVTDVVVEGDVDSQQEGISLEECVTYAVRNSFEAKMAKLDLMIAETDKLFAEAVFDTFLFGEAGYIEDKRQPASVFAGNDSQTNIYSAGISKEFLTGTQVNATWSDQRDWVNSQFVTRNPSHDAQLMLEVTQPVGSNFFGYVDRTNLSVTNLAIKNAGIELQNRIEQLISDVEKDYWDLVYAKRSMEIHKNMLERARDLNETNKRNFDTGIIERVDLLASEANVLTREKDYLIARDTYRRTEENLKLIMNMNEEDRIFPEEGFSSEPEEFDLGECLKTAFENRRDYKIRKRDVKIKDLKLKMKWNEKWPEIDLKGSFGMNGLEGDFDKAAGKTTVRDNTYYYAGIEVTVPVENSQARGGYKKASYEKEKAIVALKETERTIITQVGNDLRLVLTMNASVSNMTEAVKLQREKLDEEGKRYKYGRSTTKRLIDYQTDLLNAERQEAIELLARERSRVELERDMSTLLGKYEELI